MGDVRAERVEDELAGLRGDRDVGEIYEKTEIVVGHPHLGAEFCRVWSRSHEGGFVGKTHPLERTDAENLWIDSFIILNVVQYRKERNISFLLDSK